MLFAELSIPKVPAIEEVQKTLEKDTAIIDIAKVRYKDDQDGYCAFVLTKGELKRIELNSVASESVERDVRAWTRQMKIDPWDSDAARRLSEHLWHPIQSQLGNKQRLIICPDGPFHWLPWDALPIGAKEDKKLVIDHYTVSLATHPSVVGIPAKTLGTGSHGAFATMLSRNHFERTMNSFPGSLSVTDRGELTVATLTRKLRKADYAYIIAHGHRTQTAANGGELVTPMERDVMSQNWIELR